MFFADKTGQIIASPVEQLGGATTVSIKFELTPETEVYPYSEHVRFTQNTPAVLVWGVKAWVSLFQNTEMLLLMQFLGPQTGLVVTPDLMSEKARIVVAIMP